MGAQSIRPLADRALDGKLTKTLTDWKDEGVTFAEMAFKLRTEHDLAVSAETVRVWCTELGIHTVTAREAQPQVQPRFKGRSAS